MLSLSLGTCTPVQRSCSSCKPQLVSCPAQQGLRPQKTRLQQIRAAATEELKSPDDTFVLEMIQAMLTDSDLRKQLDQALSPEAKAKLSKLSSAEAAKKASEQSMDTSAKLKEQLRGTGCSNLQELFSLMGFSPSEAADLILSAHEQSVPTK